MVYYQIYLTQIYFGIICAIRKYIYISFETVIVYLMSTIVLTFTHMYFAKRCSANNKMSYYIQMGASSVQELADNIVESKQRVTPEILV